MTPSMVFSFALEMQGNACNEALAKAKGTKKGGWLNGFGRGHQKTAFNPFYRPEKDY